MSSTITSGRASDLCSLLQTQGAGVCCLSLLWNSRAVVILLCVMAMELLTASLIMLLLPGNSFHCERRKAAIVYLMLGCDFVNTELSLVHNQECIWLALFSCAVKHIWVSPLSCWASWQEGSSILRSLFGNKTAVGARMNGWVAEPPPVVPAQHFLHLAMVKYMYMPRSALYHLVLLAVFSWSYESAFFQNLFQIHPEQTLNRISLSGKKRWNICLPGALFNSDSTLLNIYGQLHFLVQDQANIDLSL